MQSPAGLLFRTLLLLGCLLALPLVAICGSALPDMVQTALEGRWPSIDLSSARADRDNRQFVPATASQCESQEGEGGRGRNARRAGQSAGPDRAAVAAIGRELLSLGGVGQPGGHIPLHLRDANRQRSATGAVLPSHPCRQYGSDGRGAAASGSVLPAGGLTPHQTGQKDWGGSTTAAPTNVQLPLQQNTKTRRRPGSADSGSHRPGWRRPRRTGRRSLVRPCRPGPSCSSRWPC